MCHARALDYECSLIILSQGYKSKKNGSKCALSNVHTRKIANNYTKVNINDIKRYIRSRKLHK